MLPRFAEARLARLVDAFRVVILNGPRQSGKTTLLRQYQQVHGGDLRSLDTSSQLDIALSDPISFAATGPTPRIIDEIQRGGDPLVLAIKYVVDRDDSRGQFVLSGSTRFLSVPTLSESLAGRAAFVDLWPFATAERMAAPADFCERLFAGPAAFPGSPASSWSREAYLRLIGTGGYPEVVASSDPEVRDAWFEGYLRTVVQRDIVSFADIQHGEVVPRLLSLIAARAGSVAVLADLARGAELAHQTTRSYLSYLDTVFLIGRVPAWGANLSTKATRTPRIYLTDSGLAAYLLDLDERALGRLGHPALGGLLETFVYTELTRLLAASGRGTTVRYLRDRDGREVDFILERRDGRVVGIEVKASATVAAADFRHLRWLRERIGDRLAGGYVLHLGPETGSFGDGMAALPLSAMWHHQTGAAGP